MSIFSCLLQVSASHSHQLDCQRCLLNTLSNRTMSLDCNELINSSRFISQRQYKRKLKRDGTPSYATMDRSKKRSLENAKDENPKLKMVSKTTFKLRYYSTYYLTSIDKYIMLLLEFLIFHKHEQSFMLAEKFNYLNLSE